MKTIAVLLTVTFSLMGSVSAVNAKDIDYKIVVDCEKTSPKVYVFVIESTCYIIDSPNVGKAIALSEIDPKNVSDIVIFKKGGSDEWTRFTSLLKEYEGRVESIYKVNMKSLVH